MQNVQKLSRYVRAICKLFFIIIPLITCYAWLIGGTDYDFISKANFVTFSIDTSPYTTQPLTYDTKIYLCIITLLKDCIYLYALMILMHLFKNYERCEIFSLENVKYYQKLSYSVFYWILGETLYNTLSAVILTLNNGKGVHSISFEFDSSQITALVLGLVVLIISHVMKEGYLLSDENQLTI